MWVSSVRPYLCKAETHHMCTRSAQPLHEVYVSVLVNYDMRANPQPGGGLLSQKGPASWPNIIRPLGAPRERVVNRGSLKPSPVPPLLQTRYYALNMTENCEICGFDVTVLYLSGDQRAVSS